ncbi:GlxA family transcriptional regulator [Micromonospora sp. WMMA1923]|uniref:GlxA family transcriptional regulator n=1 Tax=Micromonospora sp. WMMA1923 TaxID=3404125 RepID=UPI003B923C38
MGGVRVVVVGYPAAELLDIACLTTTFDYANRAGRDPRYTVGVASPGGRPISCQSGLTLAAQTSLERLRGPIDTLIVAGGEGHLAAAGDARLVGHVRRLARETRRVASVCTGASVLAAAGLLDGRRATTHWMFADQLAATYPAVRVDPTPLYVRDGQVSTAAGVTSALDLALAFVAEDHGGEVARRVAQGLVTYLHRPGNQAQMSMFLTAPAPSDALVRRLVAMINDAPAADLSLTALAARAALPGQLPGHGSAERREHEKPDPQRHVQQHAELGQRPGHHPVAPVVPQVPDAVPGQHQAAEHEPDGRREVQRTDRKGAEPGSRRWPGRSRRRPGRAGSASGGAASTTGVRRPTGMALWRLSCPDDAAPRSTPSSGTGCPVRNPGVPVRCAPGRPGRRLSPGCPRAGPAGPRWCGPGPPV